MHPISIEELNFEKDGWRDLYKLGGFPEPFLSGRESDAKRWRRDYRTRLLREELTGLEQIQDLGTLELLALRLPDLVGSPLSINSLREDLQVNYRTVEKWIGALDSLYYIYQLSAFGSPKIKSV
ncbi:DUF4143 domain-containing protein, partial [Acinetobacter baylyi]|uniref:DUF4143 domain-containing protein n=1 Tax=Acinetobacter baylyi TaxID=202950 RepID=UPI001C07F395